MLQSNYIIPSLPRSLCVYLEGSVHASAGNIVGSLTKPDPSSLGCVLAQRLKEKEMKDAEILTVFVTTLRTSHCLQRYTLTSEPATAR